MAMPGHLKRRVGEIARHRGDTEEELLEEVLGGEPLSGEALWQALDVRLAAYEIRPEEEEELAERLRSLGYLD